MKNLIEKGEYLEWPNTTGAVVLPGAVVVAGALTGIAVSKIDDQDAGTLQLFGVFELPKVAGTAFAIGDKLNWDATTGNLTKAAGTAPNTNIAIGTCWKAALAADLVAQVVLTNNI